MVDGINGIGKNLFLKKLQELEESGGINQPVKDQGPEVMKELLAGYNTEDTNEDIVITDTELTDTSMNSGSFSSDKIPDDSAKIETSTDNKQQDSGKNFFSGQDDSEKIEQSGVKKEDLISAKEHDPELLKQLLEKMPKNF